MGLFDKFKKKDDAKGFMPMGYVLLGEPLLYTVAREG